MLITSKFLFNHFTQDPIHSQKIPKKDNISIIIYLWLIAERYSLKIKFETDFSKYYSQFC